MQTSEKNKDFNYTISREEIASIFNIEEKNKICDTAVEYVKTIASGYFGNDMTSWQVANQKENNIFFSKSGVPEYICITVRLAPEPLTISCHLMPVNISNQIANDLKTNIK